MTQYFEIYGNRIKLSEIKTFRIIQKEYIYRPSYKEKANSLMKALSSRKYEFNGMLPYAAILDEDEYKSALGKHNPKNFAEAVGKDIIDNTFGAIGEKLHIKSMRSKKYKCKNQAGREFMTYLEDIPALLMRNDGKFSDVRKDDELYPLLGEPIAPAINMVHALEIKADKTLPNR